MRSTALSLRLAGAALLILASAPVAAAEMAAPAVSNATADAGGANSASTARPAEPKEEKMICRRQDASESRLGGKPVCMTRAQWRAQSQ